MIVAAFSYLGQNGRRKERVERGREKEGRTRRRNGGDATGDDDVDVGDVSGEGDRLFREKVFPPAKEVDRKCRAKRWGRSARRGIHRQVDTEPLSSDP